MLLLPCEILALTVAFDAAKLVALPTFWAHLVVLAPQTMRLAGAVVVALILIDGRRLVSGVRRAGRPDGTTRAVTLAVHLATIAAFARTTSILLDGNVAALPHRPAWTIAWLLLGLATVASWSLTLFDGRVWSTILRPDIAHAALALLAGAFAWGSGFVTEDFWKPMATLTFRVVAWIVGGLYGRVVADPTQLTIGTPAFGVIISPVCSGYEGIGLLIAFLSVYLWFFRTEFRFPAALLLLPLGALTIWVVNALRIVALIVIGSSGWPAVAAGGFHSEAGWLAFNAIAVGFVALSGRVVALRPVLARASAERRESDSTAALLAPFVASGAVGMIARAASAGFDWLYPLRIVAAALVCWRFRRQYGPLRWSWAWWPLGVGASVCAVWLLLAPGSRADTSLWTAARSALPWPWAIVWMVSRVAGYVVVAPFVEELAFRAYLLRRLQSAQIDEVPLGQVTWLSLIGSSLAFGALHGSMWVAGTVAGLSFALSLYRRRTFSDAVMAHGVANGLLAGFACVSGHWSVWS